jgi:hypothetical protein
MASQTASPKMPDVRKEHVLAKIYKRPLDLMGVIDQIQDYLCQLYRLPKTPAVLDEARRTQDLVYDYGVQWEREQDRADKRAKRARL